MVPSRVIMLTEWPRTASGKIDRKQLVEVSATADLEAPSGLSKIVQPTTPQERVLLQIVKGVIGAKHEVSVDANFFELGGDSIQAIEVVSRAKRIGIELTPSDFFQNPTVAALARIGSSGFVGSTASADVDELSSVTPVSGPVEMSWIQQWFFGRDPADPHHFNQAVVLELRRAVTAADVEAAIRRLTEHHDALRHRFVRGPDGGWTQFCPGVEEQPSATMSFVAVVMEKAIDSAAATAVQSSLDLEHGPLVRAGMFGVGTDKVQLLLVIHHLVVDAVSWRILLEDLERLLTDPSVRLPAKTASYKRWASEGRFYRPQQPPLVTAVNDIPVDFESDENMVESIYEVRTELSADMTEALLRGGAPSGKQLRQVRARPDDLLLTALALAIAGWSGRDVVRVDQDRHGRNGAIDVSRTVGWFTAIVPLRLQVDTGAAVLTTLQRVIAQVKASSTATKICDAASVSFNYLGQLDQTIGRSALFAAAPDAPIGDSRSPRQRRANLLEISAAVAGGRLVVTWYYSCNVHTAATIEMLSGRFGSLLQSLLGACAAAATAATEEKDGQQQTVVVGPAGELGEESGLRQNMFAVSGEQG
jgi:non-ribosomal peptide synthase protein (TIGR01720 family)